MSANGANYDDPAVEKQWCIARRQEVVDYLKLQGVKRRRVGEGPAWHLAPYVSIWAIESYDRPEWVGWWVICGDLPTDYVSAETVKHPRHAMKVIAERWAELASYMQRGVEHPNIVLGPKEKWAELGPLLKSRSVILSKWVDDDDVWAYLDEE